MFKWPTWKEFRTTVTDIEEKLSKSQIKIGEGFAKFKERHPIIYDIVNEAIPFMPPPVNGIIKHIYEKYGEDKEGAAEEIFTYVEQLSKVTEENYVKISQHLEMIEDNMAKEETLLYVKNVLVSSNDKLDSLLEKSEEFGMMLSGIKEGQDVLRDEHAVTHKKINGLSKEFEKIREGISKTKIETKNSIGSIIEMKNQPTWFTKEVLENGPEHIPEQHVSTYMRKWYDVQIKVDLGTTSGIKKGDLFAVVYSEIPLDELEELNIAHVDETMVEITVISVQPNYCTCRITNLSYTKLDDRTNIVMKKLGISSQEDTVDMGTAEKIKGWVMEGELVVLIPREQKLVHDECEDLYNQTLSDKLSDEKKKFYYEEMVRKNRKYLLNYAMSYFAPNALFQVGYALFKLNKFEQAIQTFELFLEQYPLSVSAEGAKEWIDMAEKHKM